LPRQTDKCNDQTVVVTTCSFAACCSARVASSCLKILCAYTYRTTRPPGARAGKTIIDTPLGPAAPRRCPCSRFQAVRHFRWAAEVRTPFVAHAYSSDWADKGSHRPGLASGCHSGRPKNEQKKAWMQDSAQPGTPTRSFRWEGYRIGERGLFLRAVRRFPAHPSLKWTTKIQRSQSFMAYLMV
jgi:hypothetical protein